MIFSTLVLLAATLSSPPKEDPLLDQGYRDMYNLEFEKAHSVFQRFETLHPGDPMGPVSDAAAYLFFAFDRLKILRSDFFTDDGNFSEAKKLKLDPQVNRAFEADLDRSKRLAEAVLRRAPNDTTALLSTVLRIALQADFEALIEKRNGQALNDIKEATQEARKLLAACPECYDANLAVGVENYLLSQKSAPIRWFLRLTGAETDKAVGIDKLRIVAQKGTYLKPYARVLLAIADLRDDNSQEARQLIAELARDFPENDLFKEELKKLS